MTVPALSVLVRVFRICASRTHAIMAGLIPKYAGMVRRLKRAEYERAARNGLYLPYYMYRLAVCGRICAVFIGFVIP